MPDQVDTIVTRDTVREWINEATGDHYIFGTLDSVPEPAATDLIHTEGAPVSLGQCSNCDSGVYDWKTPWPVYREWLSRNYLHYSSNEGGHWSQYEGTNYNNDPILAHRGCIVECTKCSLVVERNIVKSIEANQYCPRCVEKYIEENGELSECNNCETSVSESRAVYSEFLNGMLCPNCNRNRHYACENCGFEGRHFEVNNHDCRDYITFENLVSDLVHSYSYIPSPIFSGVDHYYLGVELEIEFKGNIKEDNQKIIDTVSNLYNKLGTRGYLKFDGSLEDGIEIVTHPMSLQYHQEVFPWKDLLLDLQKNKFRSWNTDNCGLHVHICKPNAYKDEAHRIRFMKLIYDNQEQAQLIAGRKCEEYASFDDKGSIIAKVKYDQQDSDRYSAINVENDNTDEIRIFRGSLRPERVLCAIEFVHASVEYTRNMRIVPKNKPLSWVRFVAYVSNNSDKYPNLFLIMNEIFERSQRTPSQSNDGGND